MIHVPEGGKSFCVEDANHREGNSMNPHNLTDGFLLVEEFLCHGPPQNAYLRRPLVVRLREVSSVYDPPISDDGEMTDRSGSFSPGPGAGNGRNTNKEAGPEGSAFSGSAALVENAIVSLAIAARIAGIPADPESLCRAFPSREPSAIPLS